MIAAISLALPSPSPPFAAAMPGFADVLAEQAPVPTEVDRFTPTEESKDDDEVAAMAPILAAIMPPVTGTVAEPPASVAAHPERAVDVGPIAPTPRAVPDDDDGQPTRFIGRGPGDPRSLARPAPRAEHDQRDNAAPAPHTTGHREQRLSPPAPPMLTPPAVWSGALSSDSGTAKDIDAAPRATPPARSTAPPPVAVFAAPKPLAAPVTITSPLARETVPATSALAIRIAAAPTDPVPVAPDHEPRVGGPRPALAAAPDRSALDRPPAAPAVEPRVPDPATMPQPVAPPVIVAVVAPPVKEPPHADPARASATTPDVTVTTPALGEVSAAVTARPGDTERLSVHFAVEREATAALIATGDGLARALTLAGATLDTVSIEVRGDRSDGGTGDPRADAHTQPHARDGQPEARRRPPARPAPPPSPPAPARRDRFA